MSISISKISVEVEPCHLVVRCDSEVYRIPRNGRIIECSLEYLKNAPVVCLLLHEALFAGVIDFCDATLYDFVVYTRLWALRESGELRRTYRTAACELRAGLSGETAERKYEFVLPLPSDLRQETAQPVGEKPETEEKYERPESEAADAVRIPSFPEVWTGTSVHRFRLDSLGIVIAPEGENEVQLCEAICVQAERGAHYIVGDLLVLQEARYGDTFNQAALIFGKSASSLKEIKRVCSRVEKCGRPDYLSFSQVAVVASRVGFPTSLETEEQRITATKWHAETQELFVRARVEKLTVAKLRKLLRPSGKANTTPIELMEKIGDLLRRLTPENLRDLSQEDKDTYRRLFAQTADVLGNVSSQTPDGSPGIAA